MRENKNNLEKPQSSGILHTPATLCRCHCADIDIEVTTVQWYFCIKFYNEKTTSREEKMSIFSTLTIPLQQIITQKCLFSRWHSGDNEIKTSWKDASCTN